MLHERFEEAVEVYIGSHGAFTADQYFLLQFFFISVSTFD